MDTQFNTLVRSYHDNFLQYRLTGNPSYQSSYSAAEQGIQTILNSLQSQVESQKSQMSEFYKDDVEARMKELQSQSRDAQRKFVSERDQIEAAKLRSQTAPVVASSDPLMSRYIALGAIGLTTLVLMAL